MTSARRWSAPAVVVGMCALALSGPAGAVAAPTGLVAGYGFEEDAGAAVADVSAAGNNGSVSGAVRTASGRFGRALSFDGVNDIVSVPDANSLDLTGGMTLEAWVKPSALGSVWRSAILKERPGDLVYGLYANSSNGGKPAGEASIGGYQEIFGPSGLPLNAWTHLATTFDGATQRLYVGGVQVASRTVTGAMTAGTGALKIGGNTVWGEWFKGVIDEVRVYNRALSAAEIQSDMNTAVAAAPPPPAPDTTPPTASVTAPSQGASVSGSSVAVAATATDDTAVANVQFKLDGANLGSADTAAPYQVTWNSTGASDGSHTLTAVATDAAGNPGTSVGRSVTVANAAPTPTPTPVPAQAGLVAAYGFNEGSGSSAGDLSGKGNVGSVLGGAGWASTGRFGKALAFNGSNGSVKVADSASLDLTTGMTLEAWVKPTALAGWSCVILKERPEIHHLSYEMSANTSNDKPSSFIWVGSAERGVYGGGKLPLATWSHLASTYDGATLRLYVNGVLASSTAVAGAITASSGDLRIGGNSLWGEWFNGLIDEVRIYKQPLSAVDIHADMARPL